MARHRKSRPLVSLARVGALCALAVVAGGGSALAVRHISAPRQASLDGIWTASLQRVTVQPVTVYACVTAGTVTGVSASSPDCPADSVETHWTAQSGPE